MEGPLRDPPRQGEGRGRAAQALDRRRPHLPGDGLGPRGGGHRLASPRGHRRQSGQVSPRRLQRDHPEGHQGRLRRAGGARHGPRQRAAGAAPPRPRGGLHALAAIVAQGCARPLGGQGAVGRRPPRRGARAGDPRLRARRVLGDPGGHGHAREGRPLPRGEEAGRRGLQADLGGRGGRGGPRPPRRGLRSRATRGQADEVRSAGALHHLDPAAGRELAARLRRQEDDDDGAEALRGGLHHLHANRFDPSLRGRGRRLPGLHREELRLRLPARIA